MVKCAFLAIFAVWGWLPAAAAGEPRRPEAPELRREEPGGQAADGDDAPKPEAEDARGEGEGDADPEPNPDPDGDGDGEEKNPPAEIDPKLLAEIQRLVGQLAHEVWGVRERAQARLQKIGRPAAPALRKAAASEDLEVATRAKAILRAVVGMGWLGVEIRDPVGEDRGELEVPEDTGAVASRVLEGTPAEKAGILVGDLLHTLNGKVIRSANHLVEMVADTEPGTRARAVLFRAGRRKELEITIGRRPKEYMPDAAPVPE